MNTTDCCLDSIICEIISIFKEITMDINVTKVEVQTTGKFGPRKVLHVADGTKWNVAEKKPFYDLITGPGIYSVEIAEFQGKPYIKYLSKKGNGGTTSTAAAEKPQEGGVLSDKLAFEKAKQNDILVEFYARLAFDILNAKNPGCVSSGEVMLEAGRLVRLHKSTVVAYELDEGKIQTDTFEKVADEAANSESSSKPEDGVPW